MKILISNDDGIDAPGIDALVRAAIGGAFSNDGEPTTIIVAAPDRPRSECSHSLTTRRDLRRTRCDRWQNLTSGATDQSSPRVAVEAWAIDGTPADCVRSALLTTASDVDWVFAGINAGANVGTDTVVSGTVAAAREATWNGVPAVAWSQYRHPDHPRGWDHAAAWMARVWPWVRRHHRPGHLINVNFPAWSPGGAVAAADDVPPIQMAPTDTHPMPRNARWVDDTLQVTSDFQNRPRDPGTDIDVCFGGAISVSVVGAAMFD